MKLHNNYVEYCLFIETRIECMQIYRSNPLRIIRISASVTHFFPLPSFPKYILSRHGHRIRFKIRLCVF